MWLHSSAVVTWNNAPAILLKLQTAAAGEGEVSRGTDAAAEAGGSKAL
jgi:hypothetical protein